MNDTNDTAVDNAIYRQYVDRSEFYRSKYGKNAVLLMEVGSFYEMYTNDNDGFDRQIVENLTNLNFALKPNNIYQGGFNVSTQDKWINAMTNVGLIVIIYEQKDDPKSKNKNKPNKIRVFKEIISPSMNIYNNNKDTYIGILLLEDGGNLYKSVASCIINNKTGDIYIMESVTSSGDYDRPITDLRRISSMYNFTEIIIYNDTSSSCTSEFIKDVKDVFMTKNILDYSNYSISDYKKIEYKKQFLRNVYSIESILDPLTILNISNYNMGSTALICGIQTIQDYNPRMVHNLKYPIILNTNNTMLLDNDSVLQLNINSSVANEPSIINILNKCKTVCGRNEFIRRIYNPIYDVEELRKRYNKIADIYATDYQNCVEYLKNIFDIELMIRRITHKSLSPSNWNKLDKTLINTEKLSLHIDGVNDSSLKEITDEILGGYDCLNLDKCISINRIEDISHSIFKKGIYVDLDELQEQFDETINSLKDIVEQICSIDKQGNTTQCKLMNTTKNGYCIIMTKNRFDNATNKYADFKIYKQTTYNKTTVQLTNSNIAKLKKKLEDVQPKLIELSIEYYKDFIEEFSKNTCRTLYKIVEKVANYDVLITNVINIDKHQLSKPKIMNIEPDGNSQFKIKGSRNLIVEHRGFEYITNNVKLDALCMLMYGINSSGKSCLMKTIGSIIILAQAGMYVPCNLLKYVPYTAVYTRISSADDIYRGNSSFVNEIKELSTITNNCDNRSLIIGDEVCRGTENLSATAIVASSLTYFTQKNATCLFATHLHELVKLDCIKNNEKILIRHMSVENKDNTIIYKRKLEEGQGDTMYGIEMCRFMNIPFDIIKNAEKIRKQLNNEKSEFLRTKKSNYNSNVFMDKCNMCGDNGNDVRLETHHIVFQCDDNGPLKNAQTNLIALCEKCHKRYHNPNDILSCKIIKYVDTTQGQKLLIQESDYSS